MIVIDQNNWRRNTPGRPPQVLACVLVDVHGGKISSHVSRTRLSIRTARLCSTLTCVPRNDYGLELCRPLRHTQSHEEG